MKYAVYDTVVPHDKRQETNEKLLYLIDSGKAENYGISGDDIYNLYTGDGGLHGLRQGRLMKIMLRTVRQRRGLRTDSFLPRLCFAAWWQKHYPHRRTRLLPI